MTVRTTLIAGIAAACALALPMPVAAEPAPSVTSADLADDTARMAMLDRFYRAVAMNDEAAMAELLAGAMIWRGGKGERFAGPSSDAPGAVFSDVFGQDVARFEGFGATAGMYLPSGSLVVVLGQYSGLNRSADQSLTTGFAHVFTFADGRIIHFEQYSDIVPWPPVATPD